MINFAPLVDANIPMLHETFKDDMRLEMHQHQLLEVEGPTFNMVPRG
jgi:hypothetical protein